MGFQNIFISNQHGDILLSTLKQNTSSENLQTNSLKNSSIGKSYERATMTLTNDFSDFSFTELVQEPALFITIPILNKKKLIGTVSYELDEEKIYFITHQYIGLEKTGEIVLAKKDLENLIFVAPTRNDPDLAFKKRSLFEDNPISIQAGARGECSSGVALDYRGKKVVSAWRFIPKLDWGMSVKIDLDEILIPTNNAYKFFLAASILFILLLLITIFIFFHAIDSEIKKINRSYPLNKIPKLAKNPFFILFIIALITTSKNSIECILKRSHSIEYAKKEAIKITSRSADTIETILEKISFAVQSIADDLHTNYLKKDDIAIRIKRDLAENPLLTKIALIFFAQDETVPSEQQEIYYASKDDSGSISTATNRTDLLKTKWYAQALEKEKIWLVNIKQNAQKLSQTATYACNFKDINNKKAGVIAFTFSLDSIIQTAEYNGIGQTGYSIIMTHDGTFIFHPTQSLVHSGMTLLQYAQSRGNQELALIAQKTSSSEPLMASYISQTSKERHWIYTHPIKINNWIIGSIFAETEVSLAPHIVRQYNFWTIILSIITLILLLALLWHYSVITLTGYALLATGMLFLAQICSWFIIKTTVTINRESRTIITDQSSLNKFLNDLQEEAHRKHEKAPIEIPCGILLSSLNLSDSDHITLSGYVWNKYHTQEHATIKKGMDFPQATRITFGQPLTSQQGNDLETMMITMQGILFQEQDYAKYPFDQQHIQIILKHRDVEKNIILTPDLSAYKKISPEATPGLDKEFSLSGFNVEQTFFEYHQIDPNANFGFKEHGKVTDYFQLVYNAIMARNLLDSFIIYLFPLLVILFSLFSTLLVAKNTTPPLSLLGGYSGLFFALSVLQRTLRQKHPTETTLYMEYAFFYTYITIIFLIIHTILMYYYKRWESYQKNSLYLLRILFWPFQLIAWITTTIIIFY